MSLRYNYTKNIQEKQIQTTIQQDGSIITQIGDKNAVFNMHNTNFRLSKYFLDLKTSADLGVTYSFSDADFWLNGEDRSYKMNTISPNLNISFAGIKASTITYYMSYAKLNNGISEPLSQWHQRVGAVFQIFENVIPKITLEHYRFSQTDKNDYFFADVAVSFKIPKSQHSISLSAINLFNLKEYSKLNISEYSTSVNSYRLRPRQFIIRTRFGF